MQLEERVIGDYVVRELTLGVLMDLRDQHPEGGNGLTFAMMGAAVSNGSGQPIGYEGARSLPARVAIRLSGVVTELNNVSGAAEDGEGKNA